MKIFICFVLVLTGCNLHPDNKIKNELNDNDSLCPVGICEIYKNKVDYETANLYFTKENLQKVGPINYLHYLKNFSCYNIELPACRFPKNWIKENVIDTLNVLVSDKTPCTGIFIPSPYSHSSNLDSSYIPSSTIGNEALRLLNGFYLQYYPCSIVYNADSIAALIKRRN